ncbi:hypothetical protein CAPTEDRAFT_201671 [Capitella teleta]|uniref:Uncharacterized protein n=1 Tax=Capitella teleta TaxID=283909 RepID=R7TAC2_CAPTE|nr:hypothetical protein CAPTEDRAFT_201671 [Capitella teleta]|eukprot:ELT87964.1 hypothetical protein CAPTEDRAFT_201671 [Capitella teleta]
MSGSFCEAEYQSFNIINIWFKTHYNNDATDMNSLTERGYPEIFIDGRQDIYWVVLIDERVKFGYGDVIGENVLFKSNATGMTNIGLVNIDLRGSDIAISGMTCPGFKICITKCSILSKGLSTEEFQPTNLDELRLTEEWGAIPMETALSHGCIDEFGLCTTSVDYIE